MSEYEAKIAKLEAVCERLLETVRDMREERRASHSEVKEAIEALEEDQRTMERVGQMTHESIARLWWLLSGAWALLLVVVGALVKKVLG